MKFLITGDCHRNLSKFKHLPLNFKTNPNNAIIVLGDFSVNYFLDHRDDEVKRSITRKYQNLFYIVRGNHEARPQDLPSTQLVYDKNVKGEVYVEQDYPNIRYFKDWGSYNLGGYNVLVIGGAYSVDKYYRLASGNHWFYNEQLSKEERTLCFDEVAGRHYDFVLTHTCPYQWMPTDMFLPMVDQESVDNTMEKFLEGVRQHITYGVWLFGHYHADRIERPYVEMYYDKFDNLESIHTRWKNYAATQQIEPWYIPKSPNFYMGNSDKGE